MPRRAVGDAAGPRPRPGTRRPLRRRRVRAGAARHAPGGRGRTGRSQPAAVRRERVFRRRQALPRDRQRGRRGVGARHGHRGAHRPRGSAHVHSEGGGPRPDRRGTGVRRIEDACPAGRRPAPASAGNQKAAPVHRRGPGLQAGVLPPSATAVPLRYRALAPPDALLKPVCPGLLCLCRHGHLPVHAV